MPSMFKTLTIALVALLAVGLFAATTKADVTGTFGTHISLHPQTTVSELSVINFDIENDLNVTLVISGLSVLFHTHFGIGGIEDIILTNNATLGALDISAVLVFGRYAFGSTVPFYPALHFVKKMVTASVQLGGVTFSNIAQFEDTSAFVSQTAAYAFGDVVKISGQTPSGISISAATGICMQQVPNSIKKHFAISPYTVNPDCATTPKPDILFDFETITFSGVPLAPGITSSATVKCVTISACSLVTKFTVSGGPVPFTASLTFTDLLSLSFGGAKITLTSGSGVIAISITPAGTVGLVSVTFNAVLNPDTNPATLSLTANATPGLGITDGSIALTIERAGLTFGAEATFSGGPPAVFDGLTFSLDVPGSLLSLNTDATFTSAGLSQATIVLTVSF